MFGRKTRAMSHAPLLDDGNAIPHGWITVGVRRWCLACASYQVQKNGVWCDDLVGPWPGYKATNWEAHKLLDGSL